MEKQIRIDQVTLTKAELEHVSRAIDLLKDKRPSASYTRYVADSGAIAFECPTDESCNLEVPARPAVKGSELEVTRTETSIETKEIARHATGRVVKKEVIAINGELLNDPGVAMQRLSDFKDHANLIHDVSVLRNRKSIELSFNQE